jgi:hypothetical protein
LDRKQDKSKKQKEKKERSKFKHGILLFLALLLHSFLQTETQREKGDTETDKADNFSFKVGIAKTQRPSARGFADQSLFHSEATILMASEAVLHITIRTLKNVKYPLDVKETETVRHLVFVFVLLLLLLLFWLLLCFALLSSSFSSSHCCCYCPFFSLSLSLSLSLY